MSVLKERRGESKAEYCAKARKIRIETRSFLSRLSARYARLDAPDVMHLAREVSTCTAEANSITPTDEMRYRLRTEWLLRARGALRALDDNLLDVYDTLMMNPEGALAAKSGRAVKAEEAMRRLDSMAQNLGELIADEEALLTAVLKSDREAYRKATQKKKAQTGCVSD